MEKDGKRAIDQPIATKSNFPVKKAKISVPLKGVDCEHPGENESSTPSNPLLETLGKEHMQQMDQETPPAAMNQPNRGIPVSYRKYQPNSGALGNLLDVKFFYLNEWIFRKARNVSVHLFQAGRRQNYGFMDNKFTMIYLPAKPDCLADWLECFNRGASVDPAYPSYTWHSVVALPRSKLNQKLIGKYKSNERRGFCDAPIVEDHSSYPAALTFSLDREFPKIAALAGLKKDKRVPKGWISFTRQDDRYSLVICRGNVQEPKNSKAPKGLAHEGENQHVPVEEPLFQISGGITICGLHDLFCVVEGLLRTL